MRTRIHRYQDRHFVSRRFAGIQDRWKYEGFRKSEEWREDWIAFDGACHDARPVNRQSPPHTGLPMICLAEARGVPCEATLTTEQLFRLCLRMNHVEDRGVGSSGVEFSQAPNMDSNRMCKYHPGVEQTTVSRSRLPKADGSRDRIDAPSSIAARLATPVADRPSRPSSMPSVAEGVSCRHAADGSIDIGANGSPYRSSYRWEIQS